METSPSARLARARTSLVGLSVGDAFGEAVMTDRGRLADRTLPQRRPWKWTDDTAMALSILETLEAEGDIVEDALAARFATRYEAEPWRGYGGGAHDILGKIAGGLPWSLVARAAFDGQGSMGNGGAMRAAPIGAYFADDLDRAIAAAARSAAPTHAHADGAAGAIAVTAAAAVMARGARGRAIFDAALAHTPHGPTHSAIARAADFALDADALTVAHAVGNGSNVIASDTVPYCLWVAAAHGDDFRLALWTTASAHGDMDTTCAIVGGILAATGTAEIPAEWLAAREPLPAPYERK